MRRVRSNRALPPRAQICSLLLIAAGVRRLQNPSRAEPGGPPSRQRTVSNAKPRLLSTSRKGRGLSGHRTTRYGEISAMGALSRSSLLAVGHPRSRCSSKHRRSIRTARIETPASLSSIPIRLKENLRAEISSDLSGSIRESDASYLDPAKPASMNNAIVDQAGRDDTGDA